MTAPAGTTASSRRPLPTAWWLLLVLPIVGLALLIAEPDFDLQWEHHPSHFWLVLATAAVSVALALVTSFVASRQRDARLVLISLAFYSAAGFLGLHALATPGVLLAASNKGFVIATPVGLCIASVFAACSVTALGGPRAMTVLRHQRAMVAALTIAMVVWGVLSIAGLPPLDGALPPTEAAGPLTVLAVVSVALYAFAAFRSLQFYRMRGGTLILSIGIALVLLGEAMIAVVISRNWRLSWWEWHILMLLAFLAIAAGARSEYRRSGSLTAAFGGLYLDATLARIDQWHARAIADVAAADARGESTAPVLEALRREGASGDEVELVAQAADEVRRLDRLFGPYLPSQVASRLREEPEAAELGGVERRVSVLFADLASFTTFSETRSPSEVIAMLNAYWAVVVPVIDAHGGVIEQFAGDGVMATFNTATDQPDHATRAARTALAILAAGRPLADAHRTWPVFRIGVNTGTAVVGNVGAEGRQSFAVIGDTTNTAARLMSVGEAGQVVVSGATWAALGDAATGTALGPAAVKGRRQRVDAWVLTAVAGVDDDTTGSLIKGSVDAR
ncbi:MAG TPA: adenylate/guanylate cyclase domain-containing protein [Candidatus Limnocylindrales bacterium]